MRFRASPVMLAVALGLLNPVALEDDDDVRDERETDVDRDSPAGEGEG